MAHGRAAGCPSRIARRNRCHWQWHRVRGVAPLVWLREWAHWTDPHGHCIRRTPTPMRSARLRVSVSRGTILELEEGAVGSRSTHEDELAVWRSGEAAHRLDLLPTQHGAGEVKLNELFVVCRRRC